MIKEFTVELSAEDEIAIREALSACPSIHPEFHPGRKTFAFNDAALMAICNGDFECFLWSAFDRVEERGDVIALSKGNDLVFYLPVAKLDDPQIRRAIFDYVTGRVGLNG
ncbi:hypothetical protein [Mesorhizobium koreense]|jgi:hypothetical protein|uniref:hypothetical protein n=1 Tax=Mesorhizobium koreense TaxID=3074855 RepID=UPI00287BBC39|nr:hypothetical protein [Mesorhizobium sp. WR6]